MNDWEIGDLEIKIKKLEDEKLFLKEKLKVATDSFQDITDYGEKNSCDDEKTEIYLLAFTALAKIRG
jgi:hypothetical protein